MSNKIFKIKNWEHLKGLPIEFPLEGRVFHSICLIGLIVLTISIPIDYFLKQYAALYSLVAAIFILLSLYYLSRFLGKLKLSIFLFGVFSNLFFVFIFFFAGGINGPNLLTLTVALFLMIVISPGINQRKFWSILNIFLLTGLLYTQYKYPHLITFTYDNREGQFIDHFLQYLIIATMLYFGTTYIISNYDYERRSAEEKTRAIADQNVQIISQKEELERLNEQKNKLFSIMAHDLRSPLASIQNYMDMLLNMDINTEERRFIENGLLEHTNNTAAMLSNMLSWSQMQMNGVRLKKTRVNLGKCINETLRIEKTTAINKNIHLVIDIHEGIMVFTDVIIVEIVIRNLVTNALKFTPRGGKILIQGIDEPQRFYIKVQDNGLGISEEQQKALFKLSAKTTSGTNNEKGIGLGLMLCKEFIMLLGGDIEFETQEGIGSTFTVSFPKPLPTLL